MLNTTLHHIGFVVSSIEEVAPKFAVSLAAPTATEIFEDPLQGVRVLFLSAPSSVAIELVAPAPNAGSASPVKSFLNRGGGLHHLCYEVSNLEQQIAEMRARKCLLLRPPKPAVAFGGRRIAWVMTAERLLLEYLEAQPTSPRFSEPRPGDCINVQRRHGSLTPSHEKILRIGC